MISHEIKYDSELHKRILREIQDRHTLSKQYMDRRYEAWRKAEERFLAYIPLSDVDKIRKNKKERGKFDYVTIDIPYSYALLLAAHTYWTSVFLSRSPVLQFSARHGEPEQSVQAVDALMDYQTQIGGHITPYFIWLLDVGKYGLGVVGNYWDEEEIQVSELKEVPVSMYGIPIPGKVKKEKVTRRIKGYQGNRLFNVRPFDFFPDPRVPITEFQKGEFCGRTTQLGWNAIVKKAQAGEYMNIEALKASAPNTGDQGRESGSAQMELPARNEETLRATTSSKNQHNLLEMTIELIPKEWDLGTSSYPEKWAFTVADDKVIIGATPLGMLHNKFPFAILCYEIEGHAHLSRGMLELLDPLNNILSWLFNTHMYSIRKVLNDSLIVDPSRITMKDFERTEPGRMIRLKPSAYGTDVRQAVYQMQVVDVTSTHIRDTGLVSEMMQRLVGVNDQVMGMMDSTGRKSATEVRTSSSFSINRLKTNCEYFSSLGFAPLSQMLLQNTQQFYDEEKKFKLTGDLAQGPAFAQITPETIAGFFDYIPVDGTLPVDRFAQANLWKEVLMGLEKMPQIAAQYDVGKIFSWMAQLGGLKNINQFKVNVVPDAALQGQVQAGNVVPLGAQNAGPIGIPPAA